MTDDVTNNMVVRGFPGSIPSWVLKKEIKKTTYICIIYLICNIYCRYLICILYILYIAHICRVKCEWYIKRTSFSTYIYCGTHVTDGVTDDIIWIEGTRMPWFNTRLGPEKRKKHTFYICIIYLICNIYLIYLICILYLIYCIYM